METRLFVAAAFVAGALAGCAPGPGGIEDVAPGGRSCVSLFQQLDLVENNVGLLGRRNQSVPPAIQPIAAWLRNGDCITLSRDLAGMDAALRDPATPRGDGSRARGGALVHAGAVTSIRDDARSLGYFEALGYHAYSIGTPGVGRRVFVGPMATDAGAAAAMDAARRAGFRYPYIRRRGPSYFGGIVQSR